MAVPLSRDADKAICTIYKEYLSRRNNGVPKFQARRFSDFEEWHSILLTELSDDDAKETIAELARAGLAQMHLGGGFALNDEAIIYMEQRFPNGASQVLEWLAKIKSAIPFA